MEHADELTRTLIVEALTIRGVDTFKGTTVHAYINHGRWVADCPNCNGAELVASGMPMVCGSCGAEHAVTFPRNRPKLEEVLTVREMRLQNWLPGQTPSDLLAENIEHGLFPDDMKGT